MRTLHKTDIVLCAAILSASLPSLSLSAQTSPPQHASLTATASVFYRIAGTIVNATTGEPIHHATVAVLSEEDSQTVAAVESDNDGHFSLDHLPAAKYQLTASRRGFRTAFYDEHDEFNSAIVTGPGQETANLVFRLVPGAILHGSITTDGGDPVENASVMLFVQSHNGKTGAHIVQSDSTTTDDTGAYEFSNLAPGEYLLAVVAEPWYALHRNSSQRSHDSGGTDAASGTEPQSALDVVYPVTFFDSTTDEASASRITLAGGSRAQADITLHPVPPLRIQVDTPLKQDGSIARAELRQTVFGTVISAQSAGFLDSLQTRATEFSSVAPGHYELVQGDPPRVVELDPSASMEVDPATGTLTASVRGTLRNTAGTALTSDFNLSLDPVDSSRSRNSVEAVYLRGAFTFPSVPAGQWQLSAASGGTPFSVLSVAVDGRAHAGNLITVEDRPLNLAVTVGQGGTRLHGFASRDGKGVAGVMVVLVPKDLAGLDGLARRDQSDSDGSFSLRDVVPGNYTLVAIEDGWTLDWAEPHVIARYLPGGIPVTVSDSSGKQVTLAAPVPVQTR